MMAMTAMQSENRLTLINVRYLFDLLIVLSSCESVMLAVASRIPNQASVFEHSNLDLLISVAGVLGRNSQETQTTKSIEWLLPFMLFGDSLVVNAKALTRNHFEAFN